ncbi:hypothetical protein CONE_0355 [Candidatus Kinetoplastibacterium oncopeltii TCC290E]|uniref:PD-(D/E)XK endonuclease-like domain-containing protein n=1 Tax=Candidatus Kinetoplastidibacterium stringomonadis TCC290E TaxID=1208920 RepID=M1LYC3_9PROT|nr:PD-(D/E)XK nuclease family protein [Candidatus Kinetoplastibacterium oncopeltii]AGF48159.1 hypothetical protein CONE_0355 [Candidatus Kinetoplastibacterium oncopeltii TCC290E]
MYIEALNLCEINLESVCSMTPSKSLLLTANKRQANQLMKHASDYLCSTKETKEFIQIISIDDWMINLFENLSFSNHIKFPSFFLSEPCVQVLWHNILKKDRKKDSCILNNKKTSILALDAYKLINNWEIKIPEDFDDIENNGFAYWKKYYEKEIRKINAIDINGIYSVIIKNIDKNKITLPENIVLSGFVENYPKLNNLFKLIISKNIKLYILSNKVCKLSFNKYLNCNNLIEEWKSAANWIANSFIKNPSGNYAIAVYNLDKQADIAYRILDQVLRCYRDEFSITFSISCEKSMGHIPIIRSAFYWLRILISLSVNRKCDIKNFGKAILSSRSFMGNRFFEPYSVLDLKLRDKIGIYIDIIEISELLIDYDLGMDFFNALSVWPKGNNILTIKKWIPIIRKSLFFICFSRYKFSDIIVCKMIEFFNKILNEFNILSSFFGNISADRAINLFEHFVESHEFYQDENKHKNIEVLNLQDVILRNWDAVWIIDFNDGILQNPIYSNPFLPKNILHKFSITYSKYKHESDWFRYLYKSLNQCAKELVVSYSNNNNGEFVKPSTFIDDSYRIFINVNNYYSLDKKITMEHIDDSRGPKLLPTESVIKGANVLELQSRNPLWAFAKYRLGVIGLEPYYKDKSMSYRRGKFIHRVLELFWLDVQCYSELINLSDIEIESLLLQYIENALSVDFYFDQNFIKQLESERALKLLTNWISMEKNRLPFLSHDLESRFSWKYRSLLFNLRSDRIDLIENKAIIIDYKTGSRIFNIDLDWHRQRPINLQMLLYYMAFLQKNNFDVISLIVVLLKPKGIVINGISSEDIGLSGVKICNDLNSSLNDLSNKVLMLADEYIEGVSNNFIVKKDDLKFCDIMSFLRINFNK